MPPASPDDPRPAYYLSPRGKPLTQTKAHELASGPGAILLCGRFEGIDERVIEGRGLQEISIGDFVLSGGEIAAMALIDAVVRLLPGVMGADASGTEESFEQGLLGVSALHPPAGMGGPHDPGRPNLR